MQEEEVFIWRCNRDTVVYITSGGTNRLDIPFTKSKNYTRLHIRVYHE